MPLSTIRIALVGPFFSGSHQRWAEELSKASSHQIDLITLPGRHWKWRMHGAAVTLADRILGSETQYDLIVATDMLDVAVFSGLIKRRFPDTPIAVYFHENQLTYPWSPRDRDTKKQRDLHYAFINYTSALAADRVYFNSNYHRESFLGSLPSFLAKYPDFQNKATISAIVEKNETLPLGLDLAAFDSFKPASRAQNEAPLLLWNHRWEYDKNPIGFCKLLTALARKGVSFEVALLGERFDEEPVYFSKLRQSLGDRIVAYGMEDTFETYAKWLWQADIAPVTSRQDFFGGSVVEAIYCDCHPVLPNRLAYPNHLDRTEYPHVFYQTEREAIERISNLIGTGAWRNAPSLRQHVARYDWAKLIETYDQRFSSLAQTIGVRRRKRW